MNWLARATLLVGTDVWIFIGRSMGQGAGSVGTTPLLRTPCSLLFILIHKFGEVEQRI